MAVRRAAEVADSADITTPGCDGEATTEDPQTGERVPTAGYEEHHRAGTVGGLPVDIVKAELQVAVPSAVSASSV